MKSDQEKHNMKNEKDKTECISDVEKQYLSENEDKNSISVHQESFETRRKKTLRWKTLGWICYLLAFLDMAGMFFGYDLTGVSWSPIILMMIGTLLLDPG